jgi:hypothetical protein
VRDANGTDKRCNRNLALEIGALFLALFSLICLVMGIFAVLASIFPPPDVALPPGVSVVVAFLFFAPAILAATLILILRAAAR